MNTSPLRMLVFSYALLLVSMIPGCASTREQGPDRRTPTDSRQVQELKQPDLQKEIERIASTARGRVGVSASVLETGETISLNSQDRFPMQSVYKLPIGMAVMKQVDAGKIRLEQKVAVTSNDFVSPGQHSPIRDQNPKGVELTVRELMRYAISESDGTASDVLMKLAGGPAAVQAYLNELEVHDMIVLNTEKDLGQDQALQYRNWSSPEAAVALLRALHQRRGLSDASQAFILKLMADSTPGPKRLKGLLPADAAVAHKTGTSGTQKGVTAATNDIGIITLPNRRHLAIAVFVSDALADEETREGVIAKIAKAVWDKYGRE